MIERAYKKLALDALVIQQGRLAEQKGFIWFFTSPIVSMYFLFLALIDFFMERPAVNKDELLQMVRFGAEMVFSSKDSTITDEDIDRIIAKGEEATAELDAKMKKFTEDSIKFKMDDSMPYKLHPNFVLYLATASKSDLSMIFFQMQNCISLTTR